MKRSYSKYVWAPAFCMWALMLTVVFLRSAWGKGVASPEFWLLVALSAGLVLFMRKMVGIMWDASDEEDLFREMMENLRKPLPIAILENEESPSQKTLRRYLDAAWESGNLSADLSNPGSWIRTYFRLLNEELNTPPFPRYA